MKVKVTKGSVVFKGVGYPAPKTVDLPDAVALDVVNQGVAEFVDEPLPEMETTDEKPETNPVVATSKPSKGGQKK